MLVAVVALVLPEVPAAASPWAPSRPRVEYTEGAALGIDVASPRFGWALDIPAGHDAAGSRGEAQDAYQLVVTAQGAAAPTWDSGKVVSNITQQVALPQAITLPPDTSFDWRVRWYPRSAPPASPSPWLHSTFSTGLGSGINVGAGWKGAQWVVPASVRGEGKGNQLRKRFTLPAGEVRCATLYVAVLGYYQAEVNGQRVSTKLLGDFTNFEKRVWYDTHNVTSQLRAEGTGKAHAVGITVAPGWDARHGAGKEGVEILVRLSISLEGGGHVDIISDESWLGGCGPIIKADIYAGEVFNASRTTPGWSNANFTPGNDPEGGSSSWLNVSLGKQPHNMSNPKHPWPSTLLASHASLPQITITGSAAAVDFWQVSKNSWCAQ